MKEVMSMALPGSAPVTPSPEKRQAVMESAQKERFEILKNALERCITQIDEAIPEQVKKKVGVALKSSVLGHFRMAMQAYTGEADGDRKLSGAERIARALNVFTWVTGNMLSAYSSAHGDWENAAMAQTASLAAAPINIYLNNENGLSTLFKDLAEKYPLLGKAQKLGNKFGNYALQTQ
jgi:hypothetical protein